ncbi:MAG: hypothetical protein C0482_22145 [Gordonia sp.]|nr:hypothetical protein [Gordonia sp. (in: high G+C Gram-positive bacteria)]
MTIVCFNDDSSAHIDSSCVDDLIVSRATYGSDGLPLENPQPSGVVEIVATNLLEGAHIAARCRLKETPTTLKVYACLGDTSSRAMSRFKSTVGMRSGVHLNHVWYVGTKDGLARYIRDVTRFGIGDTATVDFI